MTSTAKSSFPKDKIKVLLLENVSPTAHEIFGAEGFQVEALKKALPAAELATRVADVHILGIRSKTQVREAVLAGARRLLTVGCFCIGVNQVDLARELLTIAVMFRTRFPDRTPLRFTVEIAPRDSDGAGPRIWPVGLPPPAPGAGLPRTFLSGPG